MSIQNLLGGNGADVFTIRVTETVKSAANRMREHGISALVVKSDDAVTGLITERDIVHAVSWYGEKAISMTVLDVMSHVMISVAPGDGYKRAMSLMIHHRVRDLAVIADGEFVGIVNIGNVAQHRLEDLETESNVLRDAYIAAL